jgi:hypothetical protein
MAVRRRAGAAALLVAVVAALWYLRDPAWLAHQTTGLRPWQRDAGGRAYRWSGGHASFFVPSGAKQIRVPVATIFDARQPRGDEPMLVTFTVDDRRAGRVLLGDARVQEMVLDMPPPGSRRLRRVDVRSNITRVSNLGVMVGPVSLTTDGAGWRPCCLVPD